MLKILLGKRIRWEVNKIVKIVINLFNPYQDSVSELLTSK